MAIPLVTLALALALRIGAKTFERRRADALIAHIMNGDKREAVTVVRAMVAQPSIGGAVLEQIFFHSAIIRFAYLLFAFSLATTDARTPSSFELWSGRHKFHALRDREIYDLIRAWERVFFLDAASAIVLFGAIIISFSALF